MSFPEHSISPGLAGTGEEEKEYELTDFGATILIELEKNFSDLENKDT